MTKQTDDTSPAMRYPQSDDFPTGPELGERLPDITLPDQHGNPVTIEEARGEGRALVMFHRSVRW